MLKAFKFDTLPALKIWPWLLVLALLGALLPSLISATPDGGRKIVIFDPALNEPAREAILNKFGAVKIKDLSLINGSAVILPPAVSDKALEQHPGVLRVDDDIQVFALEKPLGKPGGGAAAQPAQVLPWGIDRINAELVWPTGNTADPIKVAVIDTGISASHPDLLTNIKGGVNTINPIKSWNDDNGHGSHVAGIIGAVNNTIGVVGAGPSVDLYAIKVLNRQGSGFLSDIIEGIQWAIANNMRVINMSLGASSNVQSFHDAVKAAYAAGIVQVAAAGNNGVSVLYPAAYPEVIAVSATDQNNVIAYFSSRGPEIDLAAPGVGIYSTYKGTGYATLSGTSMASPHVAGTAALVLNTPALNDQFDLDADGVWEPAEVQTKLQATATNLGNFYLYGSGLVNAYQAVQFYPIPTPSSTASSTSI